MTLVFFKRNFTPFGKKTVLLPLITLLLSSFTLRAGTREIKINGRPYQPLTVLAGRCGMSVRRYGESQIELYDQKRKLVFFPKKRFFIFNGVKGPLNFAPVISHGKTCLAVLDQQAVLESLVGEPTRLHHRVHTIIVDPGHGGRDQGAAGNGILEKQLTLKIALRVAELLRQRNFRVVMTRQRDQTLPLVLRPQIAARARADLYLSIHVNSAPDRTLSGIECFALTPRGGISSNDDKIVNERNAGDAVQQNSCLLAWHMQNALLRFLKNEDRGMKLARFLVLRETKCPATLIEIGFLSNVQEARKLATSIYQENCARAIVDGVCRYLAAIRGQVR